LRWEVSIMLIPGSTGGPASIAWVLPTIILVVVLGILLVLGMFLGKERRAYVLRAARYVMEMIRTLGGPPPNPPETS
jgi:hypothetical protein